MSCPHRSGFLVHGFSAPYLQVNVLQSASEAAQAALRPPHRKHVFLFLITLMCTGVEQLCMKTQHSCPPHLVSVCVVGPPAAAPYLPVLRCRSSTA